MTEYTSGPWTADFATDGGYDCMTHAWKIRADCRGKRGSSLATLDLGAYGQTTCADDFRSPEAEANARLIAAAPDLLAACQRLIANNIILDECGADVSAAIAKAEGRS